MIFELLYKTGIYDKEYDLGGYKMFLEPSKHDTDRYIVRDIYKGKIWERMFYKEIQKMKEEQVFVDIGANKGYHSLHANSKKCWVFAFEPNIALTKQMIKEGLITVYNTALHEAKGQTIFNLSKNSGRSRICDEGSLYVSCGRLDDFFGHFPIDVLKIDVEGNELGVLKGAKKLLEKGMIGKILLEITEDGDAVRALLAKYGYVPVYYEVNNNSVWVLK